MRRGNAAAGVAPPSYEYRPQYKNLVKKFASLGRLATSQNEDSDDLESLQQQLRQASLELEAITAKPRGSLPATSLQVESSSKATEPKTSIQMFIDAVSVQCGGTLKPLMYAKPKATKREVTAREYTTESHALDRPLLNVHPLSAKYDASHDSVIVILLSAMNNEHLIAKIHSAFMAPDGSKRPLDVHTFVASIVQILLSAPDKEKFPSGFATEETLLPLLCDIFAAVDCENRGSITWDQLSTYLLQGAMQHASDVKLSRVFQARPADEIRLFFKRPGGTLWLQERQWVATWDKGGSVLHLIDWDRMCLVAQLPNAATIVTVTCTAKHRLAISLFNHTVVIWNTSSFDGMVIEHMMLHSCSQVTLMWQSDLSRLLCGGSDGTGENPQITSAPLSCSCSHVLELLSQPRQALC